MRKIERNILFWIETKIVFLKLFLVMAMLSCAHVEASGTVDGQPQPALCAFGCASFVQAYFGQEISSRAKELFAVGSDGREVSFSLLRSVLEDGGLHCDYRYATEEDFLKSGTVAIRHVTSQTPDGAMGHFQVVLKNASGGLSVIEPPRYQSEAMNLLADQIVRYPTMFISSNKPSIGGIQPGFRAFAFGGLAVALLFIAHTRKRARSKSET